MVIALVALAAAFVLGFGAGRVKNATKLAAVKAELQKVEGSVVAEVVAFVAAVKAKL